jgi:hypothetical protein
MRPLLCVLTCLIVVAPIFGCRYSEVRVTVPHGYQGEVFLSCQTESNTSVSANVDAVGSGSLPSCPTNRTHVYVVRDGQATLVNDVRWNTTGDGHLTGIRFAIH